MNDPIEKMLRELRPAPMPAELRAKLASPREDAPVAPITWWKPLAGLAAAASVALAFLMREQPAERPAFLLSEAGPGALLNGRTVGFVDDGGQRAWEIIEVERLAGQTLAAQDGGFALLTQEVRRELVPVEIHFD